MKRKYLLHLLSSCSITMLISFCGIPGSDVFAQPVQDFIDYYDKGQKHKRSEGKFVNGFEDGEWKFWHENGNIKEISNYRNGKRHGKVTIFYENGSRQNEGFFKRNLPDSIYSEWYPCSGCKAGEDGNLKITGLYDEKVKNGLWLFYFPDGKKFKEEKYINGHPRLENSWDTSGTPLVISGSGKHREYFIKTLPLPAKGSMPGYESRVEIEEECQYRDSVLSGDCIVWHRNGKKKEEGMYLNGKRDSTWYFWHSNGKIHKKATYDKGELEGDFAQYFSNGKTETEGKYQKGKKQGLWIWYRENGNKDFEGEFREDVEHGNWTYYYSGGEKESYGLFKEGKRDSVWIFLYKTGERWKEGFYKEDIKNGKWITWFESGKKLQEGNYVNGKEDGLWTSWYEDGKKKDEGYYKIGLMEGSWAGWYPNGNKNYEGKILDGLKEGEWSFWFVSGKMREKGRYSKGKKQGHWEFYHELGGKESEGNFIDEKHDGKWTYYYACPECKPGESGQKMREETSKNGDLEGKAIVWYPGGAVQSETNFKDGKPHGEWKQYNKNGTLVMNRIYKDGTLVKDKKSEN